MKIRPVLKKILGGLLVLFCVLALIFVWLFFRARILGNTTPRPPKVVWQNDEVSLNQFDWVLDTFDAQQEGPYVIFSAYHDLDQIFGPFRNTPQFYGVYRYNRNTHETKLLWSQWKWVGYYSYGSFNEFAKTRIRVSPDDQHFFWAVTSWFDTPSGSFVMDMNGVKGQLFVTDTAVDVEWFTNDSVSFSDGYADAQRKADAKVQIFSLATGKQSATQIPAFSEKYFLPRVSPRSNAYASFEFDHAVKGTRCGLVQNVIVRSYPGNVELYRIDKIVRARYRWLNSNALEVKFHQTPRDNTFSPDADPCPPEQKILYPVK